MVIKNSSQPDRREYYRIEESILMAYSVEEDEAQQASASDSTFEIINEFSNVSAQMKTTLGRIAERSPDTASCIRSLDTKINLLAQIMLIKDDEQMLSRHDINISAGGLAFSCQQDFPDNTCLKLKLVLPPDLSLLVLKGKVVSSVKQDNIHYPYQVSLEFMALSDMDQDTISRHIMRLQATQLRQRKEKLL